MIFAQILAAAAVLLLLSYTVLPVSRRTILFCNIAVNLLWAGHYALLNAFSGSVCSLFCAFMVLVFRFKGRNRFLSSPAVPLLFAGAFLAGGIFTWQGWPSLIPMAGNLLLVAAMWPSREWDIKAACIPVAALWVVYNLMCRSWIGVVGQGLSLLANTLFIATHRRGPLSEKKAEASEKTQEPAVF